MLGLLAHGMTNKEIAGELFLSAKTVQHHVAHIYDKIDRRTRAGAAISRWSTGSSAPERRPRTAPTSRRGRTVKRARVTGAWWVHLRTPVPMRKPGGELMTRLKPA